MHMYRAINSRPNASQNGHWNFQSNQMIHKYNTRHKLNIHQAYCRTLTRQNTLQFQGPKVWNSLPDVIKHLPSIFLFKRKLKLYLLTSEFYKS